MTAPTIDSPKDRDRLRARRAAQERDGEAGAPEIEYDDDIPDTSSLYGIEGCRWRSVPE